VAGFTSRAAHRGRGGLLAARAGASLLDPVEALRYE